MNNFVITGFADEISNDIEEQIRVLRINNISHIEIRGIDGKNVSDFTLSEAKRYQKKLNINGIKVSSIGSPIGKINIKDPFHEHLEKFKHTLDIATIFQSPYIRMFSFYLNHDDNPNEYQDEVINRWKQFLSVAKDYPDITLLHENEKDIFGDTPERCAVLIEKLNDKQVKIAFDPANFVQCDVEVYPHAFNLLKDDIEYMHIKDANFSDHKVTPAGLGDGQVQNVLQALVDKKFRGFASLEPHLSMFDGFINLEQENSLVEEDNSDGEALFNVASNALRKILVEKMGQEWK
ncbi:sugar phosphate isomerase/epimerase family protein [Enterococcus timonensis]|uniref:sugar phosphate isomerase/epimerase family protein n=1 Tax=Enterococcus timonensis TaxID=1852364 RepID=UPI0008DA7C14|nr:TIM barrel protein [Enterococcus timonensis]